jgi:RNA-directed DNA polymerase
MTSGRKLTREEIWERIRATSKEDVVLSEMKRLGFWPDGGDQPTLAEAFVAERHHLETKLRGLTTELARVKDPEEALKLLHKERKAAALVRREETRRKRNADRFRRASEWHRHQQQNISWLGQGFGPALRQKSLDHARLSAQALPLVGNAAELAAAMGITINELRFLCFQRDVSTISHYQRFSIPKKSGGERIISAPMPRLKRAQYWLLANVLEKIPVTDSAHGFVRQRNILSNALPHVGKTVVVNLDLENFFPTVSYPRVKGIYRKLGYSEEVATLFAVLSTEAPTAAYELDGRRYFVKTGAGQLPQGAPTSPALSNLICRRLDKRLHGAAAKLDFAYSRYADDLTFSSSTADNLAIKKLMWRVRKIIEAEGLKIHPRKTQVMRKHQRQEVTGVVVNQKPSVCRKELKKFRALLFQIGKDGPDGKRWREGSLFNSVEGYANFVAMVNPDKGKPLQARVLELRRKHQSPARPFALGGLSAQNFRASAAAGRAPREPWWQAPAKPTPVLELTQQERDEIKRQEKAARDAAEAARNPKPVPAPAPRREAHTPRIYRPGPQQQPRRPAGRQNKIPWWVWFAALWLVLSLLRRLSG